MMLKRVGEGGHLCQTKVLNQSAVLPLNKAALSLIIQVFKDSCNAGVDAVDVFPPSCFQGTHDSRKY